MRCGSREVRDGVRVKGFVKVGWMGSLFGGMVVVFVLVDVDVDVDVDAGVELSNIENSACDGTAVSGVCDVLSSLEAFEDCCGGISGGVAWKGVAEA